MFCRHCGRKINDSALFCTFCGAKVTEKQTYRVIDEGCKHTALAELKEKRPKQAHRSGKLIGTVMAILLVVIGIAVGVGFYQTNAEHYMQIFVDAIVSGHWDKAYCMLPEENREETNVESFQNTYQVLGIVRGTVERRKEYENAIAYEVTFFDDKGEKIVGYQYDVQKRDKKRWLFFPTWSIVASDMVVRNTSILVSKNATVMIDDEPLVIERDAISEISYEELSTVPAIYREEWVTIELPAMWAVKHRIKVVEDKFTDYETIWQPKEEDSLEVLEQQYIETEQWRVVYAEYIKENLDAFVNVEGRAFPNTSYGFYDVDGDGNPEMFTFDGAGTEAVYNHIFTIRDGQVQSYEQGTDSMIEDGYSGEMYITTDHRILVARFSDAHEPARGELIEYTIENGAIKEKGFVSYTISLSEKDDKHFYKGDKEISKKKFKAILKKRGCKFQGNKIHIYGDALINFGDVMSLSFENYSEESLKQIDRDLSAYSLLTVANAKSVSSENVSGTDDIQENDSGDESATKSGDIRLDDEWCSGYKMLVPKEFTSKTIDRNLAYFRDGVEDTVLIWGGCRREQANMSEGYNYYPDGKSCLETLSGHLGDELSFSKAEGDYCCFSYVDESGIIYYNAFHCDEELTYGFEFRYHKDNKEAYDAIVEKLANYVIEDKGKEF